MATTDDEMDALLAEVAATPSVHSAGADVDLLIGRTLGRFVLKERIGKGGMGVVYRAHDPQLSRDVAIKVLADDDARDPARRARFLREARAAAGLTHAGIAAIHDVGFDEGAQVAFIAMELVDGHDLRHALANGALPIASVEKLALQIAKALARAHAAGIVHRDLKPENVMITSEGDAKVLDFGLAKHVDAAGDAARASDGATTREGTIVGTPGYMAPEQVLGRAVDARADVFAFGVLVHEMLSGTAPFVGDTPMATALAVTRDPPPTLTRSDVPRALLDVVTRCLAKEPAARFADARALVDALAPDASALSGPIAAPLATTTSSATSTTSPMRTIETPAIVAPTTAPRVAARTRTPIIAGAVVVASAIVALAVVVGRGATTSSDEPASLASIPLASEDPAVQASFRAAVLAFYDMDRPGHVKNAEQVVRKDPDAAVAWMLLALVGSDTPDGFRKMREAAKRRPMSAPMEDAAQILESFYAGGADVQTRAQKAIDGFVQRWPREYYAQYLLLQFTWTAVEQDWGVKSAQRLVALDDAPAGGVSLLAIALRRADRLDEASAAVEQALAKNPGHVVLLNHKAQILQTLGKIDEAILVMENVAAATPSDTLARYMLLDLYLMKGDDAARHRHIDVLRSGAFDPLQVATVLVPHGMQLMGRAGRVAEGQQMFEAAVELSLGVKSWQMAVYARKMEMDYLIAASAWERVEALEPLLDALIGAPELPDLARKSGQLTRLRAEHKRKLFAGDSKGAAAALLRVEALDDSYFFFPRDIILGIDRAITAAAEGRAEDAARFLEAGTIKDPTLAAVGNACSRLRVALLLHDDAKVISEGRALVDALPTCMAQQSDDKLICRAWAATGLSAAANAAHTRGDDGAARSLLDVYDTVWTDAADAPAAMRAKALRAAIGR